MQNVQMELGQAQSLAGHTCGGCVFVLTLCTYPVWKGNFLVWSGAFPCWKCTQFGKAAKALNLCTKVQFGKVHKCYVIVYKCFGFVHKGFGW